MKTLGQSTRYLVFQILDSLLARHRSSENVSHCRWNALIHLSQALQENNDEFLTGYIALVDGEKDPRNLLIAFSMDRVLCIEFDISKCVEES